MNKKNKTKGLRGLNFAQIFLFLYYYANMKLFILSEYRNLVFLTNYHKLYYINVLTLLLQM